MEEGAQQVSYPRLVRRIEAVIIDSFITLFLFIGLMNVVARLDIHGVYKAAVIAVVLILLEPLFVSTTGATIGHHLRGLRIQRADTGARPGFFRAFWRFLVKAVLGGYSVIFILATRRRQAVHDLAARTIVVLKHPDRMPAQQVLEERRLEKERYLYPPAWRRCAVIAVYVAITLVVTGILYALSVSEKCSLDGGCNSTEHFISVVFGFIQLFVFGGLLYYGWHGRLLGARRTRRQG